MRFKSKTQDIELRRKEKDVSQQKEQTKTNNRKSSKMHHDEKDNVFIQNNTKSLHIQLIIKMSNGYT